MNCANLKRAKFRSCDLGLADLREVFAVEADFEQSNLSMAKFLGANLRGASLVEVNFWKVNLGKSNLMGADLRYCSLVESNLSEAILTGAKLFGTARDDWRCVFAVRCGGSRVGTPVCHEVNPGSHPEPFPARRAGNE